MTALGTAASTPSTDTDAGPTPQRRQALGRRAQLLAGASVTYNILEAAVAVREGIEAWRGEACGCGPVSAAGDEACPDGCAEGCTDDCCATSGTASPASLTLTSRRQEP